MKPFNVYLCGVGGQGIGVLADVLTRACQRAGHPVRGCDTHGLAQRGGTVVSHLRLGETCFTPRVTAGEADLVVGLERLETLRAVESMLRPGGAVVFFDAVYQPILVRMGRAAYPTAEELAAAVAALGGRIERVAADDLDDPRMQNAALLGRIAALRLIDDVSAASIEEALLKTVPAAARDANLRVFLSAATS